MNQQQTQQIRLDHHWADGAHASFIGLYATTKEAFEAGEASDSDLFQILIPEQDSAAGQALHNAVIRACHGANAAEPTHEVDAIRAAIAALDADSADPRAAQVRSKLESTLPSLVAKAVAGGAEVIYLTNACGEWTGHGTLDIVEADLDKIPFERGPGGVISYAAELVGSRYVLANLEVAFQDEIWDDRNLPSEADTLKYCEGVCEFLAHRLNVGEQLLPIEKDSPGRCIIRVALPIESLTDWSSTLERLKAIFGTAADLADLKDLGDLPELTAAVSA